MADKNRFSKPVAFNNKNETDQTILKHVSRRNFSGYVKKLILADIESRKGQKCENEPIESLKNDMPFLNETAAQKMERLRARIMNKDI
jgi:hypothetical protein